MSAHLDEVALEALATDREELVDEAALAHLDECAECAERVAIESAVAADASVALRRAMPELDDLEAMIATAMEKAPELDGALESAPSRRSLWLGGAIGLVAASALAVLSAPSLGSLGGLSTAGRQLFTLLRAADSVVGSAVPGGWPAVALVGLGLALLLALPARWLLRDGPARGAGMITGALGGLLLAFVAWPTNVAFAYEVEGAWPEPQPTVTLDVEDQPTSEALRLAVEAAGLGVVVRLPDDPPVTLHVREAPLSEVIEALLGDRDVVVRPGASLITVRAAPPPSSAPEVSDAMAIDWTRTRDADPAPPSEPASEPAAPAPAPTPGRALSSPVATAVSDRVTFGSDVEIGPGEQVRGVYTMGGDARVLGRVLGDVVTMGGNAEIEGEVIGNVTTMGGDIDLAQGARVHGDLNAMGGDIERDASAQVHGQVLTAMDRAPHSSVRIRRDHADDESATPGIARWALWNVMLFLLGLVMLGTARGRFSKLKSELAARPVKSAVGGLFGLLAGAVLTVVLALTLIGFPGSIVLGILLFVGCWLGWTTSAWWLGSVLPLPALKDRPVLQLAVGVGVLFVFGLVPKVGTLLVTGAVLAGLGAVIATGFGSTAPHARRPKHIPTGPFRTRA